MPIPDTTLLLKGHRRTLLTLWLSAVVLLLLTWWQVFNLVGENRSRELDAAQRDLANLTRVSQEHANRTLRSADQVIRFIQSRYLEIGERLDLRDLSGRGVIDDEIFNQVGVIDAKGIYILSNRPLTSKLDLSDREHFKVHVAADTGQLFISKPLVGRATGKWSIQLTRRITRANGDFAGVVVISIDPSYFSRFYGELNLGAQGLAGLYGLDGVARVRKVGTKEEFGTDAGKAPLFEHIARGELFGSYTHRSVVDGIERLYYYRKIPQYPLAVVAGLDTQDLLLNHFRARNALWLQAALVSLLIMALATALSRYLQQIRREITSRQLATRQIQDRTEQLDAIFTLSPDGIVSFDHERCVKNVNPAFIRMTRLEDVTIQGMSESEFSIWLSQQCETGSARPDIASLRSQVTGGKPDTRQLIHIASNGTQVLQVGLRCSESDTVSQILYFRDVTSETEVDQMKSRFLSTAAHELRTPMSTIFGFSEVMLTQDLEPATQKEALGIIYKQAKLMTNIIDELLDLSRIESRRNKDFRSTRVCLQELTAELISTFTIPADRSPPEVSMPEQAVYVMADAAKLQRALLNVLTNAYKYSPQGGLVSLQIERTMKDGQAQVCIQVCDHGIGMTPVQVSQVCERFYRADTSGKIPGTGLGMSIVKEIIELHRGKVVISSVLGQGTQVSLWLPG